MITEKKPAVKEAYIQPEDVAVMQVGPTRVLYLVTDVSEAGVMGVKLTSQQLERYYTVDSAINAGFQPEFLGQLATPEGPLVGCASIRRPMYR